MTVRRLLLIVLGWFCLLVGFLTFWFPIPTGAVLMAVGLVLLLNASPRAVRVVQSLRARYDVMDRLLTQVQARLPGPMKATLGKTRLKRHFRAALKRHARVLAARRRALSMRKAANDDGLFGHNKDRRQNRSKQG